MTVEPPPRLLSFLARRRDVSVRTHRARDALASRSAVRDRGFARLRIRVYIVTVIRWLRFIATATIILSMIGLGVVAGLFLVANGGWIPVAIPPWLIEVFGDRPHEIWLPALIAGWLASAVLLAALVLWSMFYVWRRRQYESLVSRLERELAKLRNLPFTEPAPLEDLPEFPDAHAARVMHELDDEGHDWP